MSSMDLVKVARAMVAEGRGILAADESTGTCQKRFDSIGVECTEENRRQYREMLLTTPGLAEHISGVIFFDETLRQATADGKPFVDVLEEAGVLPGIKVDTGAHPLAGHPGEKVTEGLDGLRGRLEEYASLGAKFAKWRAVITIGENRPSAACIEANSHALARYAALCQEAGLVPMVEPEVLMDGAHALDECYEVTEAALRSLFSQLYEQSVLLEGTILKASMVISGSEAAERAGVEEVAEATVQCLLNAVPAALAGVVFLSGGQGDEEATAHLDAMNKLGRFPWPLSFSYGRALQHPSLVTWGADPAANVAAAQRKLAHRARMNGLATLGRYEAELEAA
ncbi:MAG: fructose-bisphosphate aldolase class I [Xanthomonadales bacterium]|nr:fructose-bisphosphate aldolase class I [Xanthomonadales bacterium]NIN58440.1 fructose-bisphosphate aldolase class I [Xanthomonadales bacterium]NIN74986.1 fructose-bisphosphate aldolase class I [Xanthomonadales bacterium]NIO13078.1 fructose-bisphosphate aldolase class I [Xanthomonadales bacterium]NIP10833.1 fructose-bisphosphate aldolase class I [Xanthomonadales bacterium]